MLGRLQLRDGHRDYRLHGRWTTVPLHLTFKVSQGVADQDRSVKARVWELPVPGELAHRNVEHCEPSLPVTGSPTPAPTGLGTLATSLVRAITRTEFQVALAVLLATYRRWFVVVKSAPLRGLRSRQLAVAVAADRTNGATLVMIIVLRVVMQLRHRGRSRRRR